MKLSRFQPSKIVQLGGFFKPLKLVTEPAAKALNFSGKMMKNLDLNRHGKIQEILSD